jgi:hypothetical protein
MASRGRLGILLMVAVLLDEAFWYCERGTWKSDILGILLKWRIGFLWVRLKNFHIGQWKPFLCSCVNAGTSSSELTSVLTS